MSKKQITLFQTWNKTLSQDTDRNLVRAEQNVSSPVHRIRPVNEPSTSTASPNLFRSPVYSKKTDELADSEFDYEAGKTWIYPTNYPVRDYQFSIVKEALFKNTLVVLPTGLGKTFIAAVVMYNIYRWFPNGKVVFMAPTKPLVAQQVDACFNITGIPHEDTTQMTGTNAPELRKRMWMKKRVFFLTPQVLVNDLVRNICPASSIKCLVVDEAHKALGNHAYCQVIKELSLSTSHFRVLALTATPGSDPQAVKQVLTNLLISHVEMRSEDSEDVKKYSHIRDIEKIVVPLGDRLNNLKSKFLDVINVYLIRLARRKVMSIKNPASLSKFQVLKLREAFSQNPPSNVDRATYGLAMADFSLLISLYHAYELLLLHGARTFYNFLLAIINGDKSIPHARAELLKNFEFEEIMESVKNNYIPDPLDTNPVQNGQINVRKKKVLPGHPKLDKLLDIVLEHFRLANFENLVNTRVMIFTQYRDSVQEIVDLLSQHQPTIKAMSFIGQASKSTTSAGLTQKQQLQVLEKFRSGGYNTLVSTCVGEEGLDIGEVDLIVCYDCPKSPIRLVQRMGRTGRLRKGRIVILIAEGKEEQMYNTCEYRKKSVHRVISKGFSFAQFYQDAPSLLPPNVVPKCVKIAISIKEKKPEPKVKVVSKSPFLNDDEMAEFNQHVKVPMSDVPLLPKREFVVLPNNQEASTSAIPVKPQLSFDKWTLWQTTPQRTDMIPHSSKSLLLVRTLERIHFPDIVNTKFLPSQVSEFTDNTLLNINASHSKRKKHSKCSSKIDTSRQSKITDCLSVSKSVIDDEKDFIDDDVIEIFPSPEREADNFILPFTEVGGNLKKVPFIEHLLKVDIPNSLGEINARNIKVPPIIPEKLLSLDDFHNVNTKDFSEIEHKSSFILRCLNNKIKARLKQKKIELFRNIASDDINTKSVLSQPNKSDVIKEHSSLQIPADINSQINIKEQNTNQGNLETIVYDIDFDICDTFSDNVYSDENLNFNKLPNATNNNENILQNDRNNLESANFNHNFLKTENLESFKHSTVSNFKDTSFENDVSSKDHHNFYKTEIIMESLNKNSEIIKTSIIPPEEILHKKKITSIQCESISDADVKNLSSSKNINQNYKNLSNDLASENESPNAINFDINFFDDDEDDLLNFNNDTPAKDPNNLSSKVNERIKFNINVSDNSSNEQIFPVSNHSEKCQTNNKNNKDDSAALTVCREKQASVLKDVKNMHHLFDHERNIVRKNNSYVSGLLNKEGDHDKIRHLQTLHNVGENNSKILCTGSKLTSSNAENKGKIINLTVSSKCPENNDMNLQDNKADDFEEIKFNNASSTTVLYNVNSVLHNSSNNYTNYKLLLKQENNKDFNIISEKSISRNIDNNSIDLNNTKVSALSDLNPENSKKIENSAECNFDFDISFDDNDFQNSSSNIIPNKFSDSTKIYNLNNNSSFSKPNLSSESTKMYSFSKIHDFDNGLDELDKDASSILKQLCSSQNNASSDLNSSFSSLTVKRCISETGVKENSKIRKKLCRTFSHASNHPSSSHVICNTANSKDSDIFKIPSAKNHLNENSFNSVTKLDLNAPNTINSPKRNLNKTVKITEEASQYSLTQLLSFINSSENMEKTVIKTPKHLESISEVSDASSDDEVCPTPPKKIIKPNTKFIYNKGRSLDFNDFELPDKHATLERHSEIIQNESKPQHISPKMSEKERESASFNDFISQADQRNINPSRSTDSIIDSGNKNKEQNFECQSSPKITFDVSFDLPFTQDEFELSEKDDMNNAILIESSSSEEKIASQNDDIEFLKSQWNEIEKTDLLQSVPTDDINKMPHHNGITDDLVFEDSESLLSSKLDQNSQFVILNNNILEKHAVSKPIISNKKTSTSVTDISMQNNQLYSDKKASETVNPSNSSLQNSEEHFDDFENNIFFKLLSEKDRTINKQSPFVKSDLECKILEKESNAKNFSEKHAVSNSVISKQKSSTHGTNICMQSSQLYSDEKSKKTVNTNNSSQSSEDHFDDFENSMFFKLLPENDPATNEQSSFIESDLECKILKEKSNTGKDCLLLSENSKNDPGVECLKPGIFNNINHKACSSSKITKKFNENNAPVSKITEIENEFKNASLLLKEKNSNEMTDLCGQNICGNDKNLKEPTDEFSEENVCFDLNFEDKTCDRLLNNNPVNCNDDESIRNHQRSPKLIIDSETQGEFRNITKRSIFKKIEIKENISSKSNSSEKDVEVNEQKVEFDLDEGASLLTNQKNNVSACNGEERTLYYITNNDSSDEFDLHDQNQTMKAKNVVSGQHVKNSKPTHTRQETNMAKNKPTSKLNSKVRNCSQAILKNNSVVEDEEDDFQFIRKIQKKTSNPSVSKRTKRRELSKRNEFLLSQAEVSGSDNSGHESDCEDYDALDGSFIDDESPLKMDYTDQHAFYLKSLKDHVGLPQKFKLKPLDKHCSFVSQSAEGYSNYEFDSFCVDDDDDVSLSSDEDVQPIEYDCFSKQELHKKNKSLKRKLKRVVTHDSSASSEHETSPKFRKHSKGSSHFEGIQDVSHDESPIIVRKRKHKRVIESSDEEDDHAFIKPAIPNCSKRSESTSAHSKDANYFSEKVLESSDANERIMFSIDFDDDVEFIGEINASVDDKCLKKPKTGTTNPLTNIEAGLSIQKPSTSRQLHSNLDVKDAASPATDTQLEKLKSNSKHGLNNFEVGPSLQKPSDNKHEYSNLDCKGTAASAINEDVTDMSFDIGWDETCPSTSNSVKISTLNDTGLSSPNEMTPCNPIVTDSNNAASVILVDSRELASGKPVISSLRNKHKINPVVMQLSAGDYVISNRIAVERVFDTEFSKLSMPPKIVEKVKEMISVYVKTVVIIEKDNRKNVLSFNKNITKYLQFVVHLNKIPQVKVLFSKSADHTSELIANLVQQERKRGFHINVPVALTPNNRKLFDFYSSFPKMTPTCALNLMYNFPTIELLFKSSAEDLKKRGCISSQKAASLYKFIRNPITFHEKL